MKKLVIAATEFELTMLTKSLQCREESRLFDFTVYQTDSPADDSLVIMSCGAGIANAAAAAAAGIALYRPAHVFNIGVCGVYNGSMEEIGQVVTGTRALFADTGVDTGTDFQSMQTLNLPLARPVSGETVFNDIQLHPAQGSHELKSALFLTVAACSGSMQRANLISNRFDFDSQELLCEDMESAAVGLMACKAGIPCTVIRAISNICGDRDYSNWKLSEAAQAAQTELLKCL